MAPSYFSLLIFSFRFRSVAFSRNVPVDMRKFAFRNKALHTNRDSLNAYVVFTHVKYADAVMACADEISAMLFEGKHLRLDRVVAASDDVKLRERERDKLLKSLITHVQSFVFRNQRAFHHAVSLWVIWHLMLLTRLYTDTFRNVVILVNQKKYGSWVDGA